MKNLEASKKYVSEHREQDVRQLALRGCRDNAVDLPWALDQIQGWQTARKKLPSWAALESIVYPPHLSMEQCSSERTALYKRSIVGQIPASQRHTLIDLTGGFGVDLAFMSRMFVQATFVERQPHLCEIARHNFEVLGLTHVQIVNANAEQVLLTGGGDASSTLLYLDPARRDSGNGRTFAIADCTPNVLALMSQLPQCGRHVLLKLSPMLDWRKAVCDLGHGVKQLHIVSVDNECKELLVLIDAAHDGEPTVHCANDGQTLTFQPSEGSYLPAVAAASDAAYLYEPNASVMKAGCYGLLTRRYPVAALSNDSHLFVSNEVVADFPGRRFKVKAITTMNKKELKNALAGITHANVSARNMGMSAQVLRHRLGLQDGGDNYLFGTTDASGKRVIYICDKL